MSKSQNHTGKLSIGPETPSDVRHVDEGAVALVAVERVGTVDHGHVEIGIAIPVVVAPGDALDEPAQIDARGGRHLLEGAVAAVAPELAGSVEQMVAVLDSDVEVDVAVVVVVGPGAGLRRVELSFSMPAAKVTSRNRPPPSLRSSELGCLPPADNQAPRRTKTSRSPSLS